MRDTLIILAHYILTTLVKIEMQRQDVDELNKILEEKYCEDGYAIKVEVKSLEPDGWPYKIIITSHDIDEENGG